MINGRERETVREKRDGVGANEEERVKEWIWG